MAGTRRRAQYSISPSVKTRRRNRSPYRSIVAAMRSISVASSPRPMMVDMSLLPQPSGAFCWVQAAAGPALVCRPLEAIALHLYTTRHWALGVRAAGGERQGWAQVAAELELESNQLIRVRQIHGASVVVAREAGSERDAAAQADIIVTDGSGLGLAVKAADCVPLLIADERTAAVAAAHGGWRGLAAGVPS